MHYAGLTLLTTLLVCVSPSLAQNHTSQIIVTGRSLAVEPATNNSAAPGGVTTFLTTYDGSSGPVLSPFSGEAKPQYLGSSNYVTDYEGHLGIMDPSGMLVNYGELVISNMPVTVDLDGDGLPDFLEKNLASSFSVDASDREDYRFDGNTNNSEWTLSFFRSADSHAGTYTLRKKSDPNNPDKIWNGNFQLKGGTGTATFDTNNKTLSVYTESFDTVYPETNTATSSYGVTQNGKLLASGFWLNSSFGPTRKIYINPFLVQRIGTTDRGRAVLYSSDGHAYDPADPGSTPYPDYTEFHLEVAGLSNSLTQTPTLPPSFPWNDDFSSTTSSTNYLDFRNSHFARLDVSGDKLNLVSSGHPYGENYGNLSIYSPPYLLLPLDSSWDLSVQVALPAPDGAYYKGVGVSLAPENDTYDIANFGATVYSFELGQDNDPTTPGTFLATYARKDWVEDPSLGLVTPVNFDTAFLRFSYNSATKALSTFYDANTSSPTRSWTPYDELNLNPADPSSVATDLGLTPSSKIRMALWADAYVTSSISNGEIWMDSLSITQKQPQTITFNPLPLKSVGNPTFSLVASASSNLGITFTSSDPSVAEVNGSTVTIKAPGLVTLTAFQAGDATYESTTAIQNLMILGSPASLPFVDDFSSLIPNRYFFYGEASTGHQLQVTNGVLRFSANAGGTYNSSAATGPNLSLPLSGNWTVSVDATMPGGSWSPTDVWLYLSLQKNDGAFVDYFTQGTNRIKVTSLKLLREGSSTLTYVNAHNYDSAARWDFESSPNNLGPDPRTVTLGWTYSATDKKLRAWYDPDTTNNPSQAWIMLHEFSTDPTVPDSLGQKWSLNLASDTLALSLSATSLDPTVGQDIYFDNLSASFYVPSPPPALTSGLRAHLNQPFSYLPMWSNAVSFSVSGLPSGLTNNPVSGVISGTPTQAGYFQAIQTGRNDSNATDFTIPITILGLPLSLPFSDDFSSKVPNQYMPYDFSGFWDDPNRRPNAGRLSFQAANGVLRLICPTNSPGHHSLGWAPNLQLPLASSWEILLDVHVPNNFLTQETQLGLTIFPALGPDETIETFQVSYHELSFYLNRDTQFQGVQYGNILERSAYVHGQEQAALSAWIPFQDSSHATLRLVYHSGKKTLSTYGRTNPGGFWTKVGEDVDLNPENSNSIASTWGLGANPALSVAIASYFEITNQLALPEIYSDNFSVNFLQRPSLPIFFEDQDPLTPTSDGLSYLMKYAYGAADPTSPITQALRPVTTLTTNTNGQPALALTYYARTNDTNLSIQPVWNTNLSAPTADWASNVTVTTLGTNSTNGLVLERRQATVPIDLNSKKFLRLKTTLNP